MAVKTKAVDNFSLLLTTTELQIAFEKLSRRLDEAFSRARSSGNAYCAACDESSSRRAEFRERELGIIRDEAQLQNLIYRTERIIADSPEDLRSQLRDAIASSRRELSAIRAAFIEESEAVRSKLRQTKEQFRSDRNAYLKVRVEAVAVKINVAQMDREIDHYSSRLPSAAGSSLQEDIRMNYGEFGEWDVPRQMAQLKVWIGKYRRLQDGLEGDGEEDREYRPILYTLQRLSKEYRPGYINAFKEEYDCDWTNYITQSQAELSKIVSKVKPRVSPEPLTPLGKRINLREVS